MKIFDLEQEILRCWQVLDMLEDNEYNQALKTVYEKQFEQMFETFNQVCGEYHSLNKNKLNSSPQP